jgi:hypothetical protein
VQNRAPARGTPDDIDTRLLTCLEIDIAAWLGLPER